MNIKKQQKLCYLTLREKMTKIEASRGTGGILPCQLNCSEGLWLLRGSYEFDETREKLSILISGTKG